MKNQSKDMKYIQSCVVEWHNGGLVLYEFVSHKPIGIDKVAKYLKTTEYFDEGRDSITFVDPSERPITI